MPHSSRRNSHSRSRSCSSSRSRSQSPQKRCISYPVPVISLVNPTETQRSVISRIETEFNRLLCKYRFEARCPIRDAKEKIEHLVHDFANDSSSSESECESECKGNGKSKKSPRRRRARRSHSKSRSRSRSCSPKKDKECKPLSLILGLQHCPTEAHPTLHVRLVHRDECKDGEYQTYLHLAIPFTVNVGCDYAHPHLRLRPIENPLCSIPKLVLRHIRASAFVRAVKCASSQSVNLCAFDPAVYSTRHIVEWGKCSCEEEKCCPIRAGTDSAIRALCEMKNCLEEQFKSLGSCEKKNAFAVNAHNAVVRVQRKLRAAFEPLSHSFSSPGDVVPITERSFERTVFFAHDDVMQPILDCKASDQFEVQFFVNWVDRRNDPWVDSALVTALEAELSSLDSQIAAQQAIVPQTPATAAKIMELIGSRTAKASELATLMQRIDDHVGELDGEALAIRTLACDEKLNIKPAHIPIHLPQMFAIRANWVRRKSCNSLKLQYVRIMHSESSCTYSREIQKVQKLINRLFKEERNSFEIYGCQDEKKCHDEKKCC